MSEIYLLTKFPSDVTETLNSVKAHRLETSVTKHLGDLGHKNSMIKQNPNGCQMIT